MGYTISNEKLLATGFEFRYSLEESLNEMISNWSVTHKNKDLEFILKGGNDYIDDRFFIESRDGTQIFTSLNYGKTFDKRNFNLTPVARVDLALTELESYTETGTDALKYDKQNSLCQMSTLQKCLLNPILILKRIMQNQMQEISLTRFDFFFEKTIFSSLK